jgi:hypothetical protein
MPLLGEKTNKRRNGGWVGIGLGNAAVGVDVESGRRDWEGVTIELPLTGLGIAVELLQLVHADASRAKLCYHVIALVDGPLARSSAGNSTPANRRK